MREKDGKRQYDSDKRRRYLQTDRHVDRHTEAQTLVETGTLEMGRKARNMCYQIVDSSLPVSFNGSNH